MIVAGLGCRLGATATEVLAAIEAAMAGQGALRLDALATVPAKAHEPALTEAAGRLGVPLFIGAVANADPRLGATSAGSLAATGSVSASEASALAAAGPGARLLGPHVVAGRVTCAIAVSEASA